MSIKNLVRSRFVEQRSALNNPAKSLGEVFQSLFGPSGSSTEAIHINRNTAASYPPIAQAVEMIAADCAKLPLVTYRRTGGGGRERDSSHRVHQLTNLNGSPNDETATFDFWFDVMFDALLTGKGKGLAWIERRGATPVGLYRLVASDWHPKRIGGRLFWVNAGETIALHDEDVLVIRSKKINGLDPDDPVRMYADTLRVGVSTQRFASKFFENGAHVGGILLIPPGASDTAVETVERSVRAKENPANWFRSLVLRDGFKFQPTTVDPSQAKMAETDEATARHVARIYNLPPSKLGLQGTVSYNSLDSDNRQYYDSTLTPWLRRIQGQVNKKLFLPSEQRSGQWFAEHLIDALEWADTQSRATIATQGINSGWLTHNEVRAWHNLPPLTAEQKAEMRARKSAGDAGGNVATDETP